jgi:hypothetical protein
MRVNLGRGCMRYVHRLVLEAFIGPCPHGMEACHWDGRPENNQLSNLRWDTDLANQADSARHGTKRKPPIFLGEKHHATTITEDDVKIIRGAGGHRDALGILAARYSLSIQTIWRIRHRKTWAHVA